MKLIPLSTLSGYGKSAVGAIVGFASLLQVPAVNKAVMPLIAHHPHFATLTGGLLTLGALLVNPTVQGILHLNNVPLKDATVSGDVTVTK